MNQKMPPEKEAMSPGERAILIKNIIYNANMGSQYREYLEECMSDHELLYLSNSSPGICKDHKRGFFRKKNSTSHFHSLN